MDDDTYLIFSVEHARWWGPGHCGYVSAISNAGRYPRDEALRICLNAMPRAARGRYANALMDAGSACAAASCRAVRI
jgi:hypothetical protein